VIAFTIQGTPRTTQPGDVVRIQGTGRRFQPKKHPEWTAWCHLIALQNAPPTPLDGPIWVNLIYSLPRPKSAPKSRRYPWQRPDVENYGKGLLDSFNGLLFHDDAQIVKLHMCKRYCDPEETPHVRVEMDQL
jgi:Holliday junction resolvase RusA-like endonuclease